MIGYTYAAGDICILDSKRVLEDFINNKKENITSCFFLLSSSSSHLIYLILYIYVHTGSPSVNQNGPQPKEDFFFLGISSFAVRSLLAPDPFRF